MSIVEALPKDIYEALYKYCRDDESLEEALLRALRYELGIEHTCCNCANYSSLYNLCVYSMGDEEYDCRGRDWRAREDEQKS